MLKAPGAELCQNACGRVNEEKVFYSHQCSPECSMNICACCMLFNAVGRPGNRAPPFPPRYNN